jgi:transketolase
MGKSNRQVYGETLAEIGKTNNRIVAADADVAGSTGTGIFRKEFADRFFNFGAAEQNQTSAMAAMSTCGLIPFISTFAVFASMRACDQVRQSIAYTNLNVKIVATNAGLENNGDGVTHQATEDIAIMRSFPNIVVMCPSDNRITQKAVRAIAEYKGPVYVRLGRYPAKDVYTDDVDFEIGKMIQVAGGNDVTIIATGRMVEIAVEARKMLAEKGIGARLLECHTLKPLDHEAIIKAARETQGIVTCEDHSVIGGLGSAVADVLCEYAPARLKKVGVKDLFARSARDYRELYERYGLTKENICENALKLLK